MPVSKDDVFLGFDPGGHRKFGVALLQGDKVLAMTCSGIAEVVSWAVAECEVRTPPIAAGIDTLLHWSTAASGLRSADQWLRERYPEARASVMCPNSLYGAMTIGGMGLALELRRIWPQILLNETHPKVLYFAMERVRYQVKDIRVAVEQLATRSNLVLPHVSNDDELDAILSAWATREGYLNGWRDLTQRDGHHLFPAGEVDFLWPE